MKILNKKSLNKKCNILYKGAVFTNNSYKLVSPDISSIDIYSSSLCKISSKEVCDRYSSITSNKNDIYYGIKEDDYSNIYVLDGSYNEVDTIKLKIPQKYRKKILSINIDKDDCKFIICLDNIVISTSLKGDFIKEELSTCTLNEIKECNNGIIRYGCSYVRQSSIIRLTSAASFCSRLFITFIKNESLYLSEISENGNIINTYFVGDEINCLQIFMVKSKIELLISKDNKYNYIYKTDIVLNKLCNYKSCCEIKKLNECRVDISCEKDNCCSNNLCEIIESIALIENSLASILSAEGEKIKKAIKIACNTCDLVEVNDSVTKTINSVTMLEQILTEKLSISLKENCYKGK